MLTWHTAHQAPAEWDGEGCGTRTLGRAWPGSGTGIPQPGIELKMSGSWKGGAGWTQRGQLALPARSSSAGDTKSGTAAGDRAGIWADGFVLQLLKFLVL